MAGVLDEAAGQFLAPGADDLASLNLLREPCHGTWNSVGVGVSGGGSGGGGGCR